MRRPSGRCTPNTVTIAAATWRADLAGGRTFALDTPSSPFVCALQPASSEDVPDHLREQGVTYHLLILHDDPGDVPPRSQVVWQDRSNRTMATRSRPVEASGQNRSWRIVCEERPAELDPGPK